MTDQDEIFEILKYGHFYPKKVVRMIDDYFQKTNPHLHLDWYEYDQSITNTKECYGCRTDFLYITVHWSDKQNSTVIAIFNHIGDFGNVFAITDYPKENILPVIEEIIQNVNNREIAKEYYSGSERG